MSNVPGERIMWCTYCKEKFLGNLFSLCPCCEDDMDVVPYDEKDRGCEAPAK